MILLDVEITESPEGRWEDGIDKNEIPKSIASAFASANYTFSHCIPLIYNLSFVTQFQLACNSLAPRSYYNLIATHCQQGIIVTRLQLTTPELIIYFKNPRNLILQPFFNIL
jgi:hypothetical protein